MTLAQLLPLGAGLLYALAAILLKLALHHGVGPWRITFVANWAMAILFLPMLSLGGTFPGWHAIWQPLLFSGLFFGGQIFTFFALHRGHVSIATPVMGTKVILVALFGLIIFQEPVPWKWWIGAALTSFAILLLGGGTRVHGHRVGETITWGLSSAAFFALADLCMQQYGSVWGPGFFIPIGFAFVGLFSLAFIPFFSSPLSAIRPTAWPWLALGSFLLAIQALGMALALANFGAATMANILYSSRGLWSVLLMILLAPLLHWGERQAGTGTMLCRLGGALIMLAAIALVLL